MSRKNTTNGKPHDIQLAREVEDVKYGDTTQEEGGLIMISEFVREQKKIYSDGLIESI